MRDHNWWRSDEAIAFRAAQYLSSLLWTLKDHRRVEFMPNSEPEWPAVFHYNTDDDAPYWLEVRAPIHARDYARGSQDMHMNAAAKKLAAED